MARRLVWEALAGSGHQTAQQVYAKVAKADPTVNLSSVYRALALFDELELVRESKLNTDGGSHWEPIHTDDHFHLVCRNCGKVDHHAGDMVGTIKKHLVGDHGFQAEAVELVATGLCSDCS